MLAQYLQQYNVSSNYSNLIKQLLHNQVLCKPLTGTHLVHACKRDISYLLSQYTLPIIPQYLAKLLDHKINFKAILRKQQIPYVLDGSIFAAYQCEQAIRYCQTVEEYPVVIKPVNGENMEHVGVALSSDQQVYEHWQQYLQAGHTSPLFVEKYLPNCSDFRFFLFRDGSRYVQARYEPSIVGNGENTVEEIMCFDNALRGRRADGRNLSLYTVDDKEAIRALADQGLSLSSVPAKNQVIRVRYGTDVNQGGMHEVIADNTVHPEYWQLLTKLWALFPQMPFFSVDILSPNVTEAPQKAHTAINEAHIGPSVELFLQPARGQAVNLYQKFVDILFP